MIRHVALCEWCHQRKEVTDGRAADEWLRTHDCPEDVKRAD